MPVPAQLMGAIGQMDDLPAFPSGAEHRPADNDPVVLRNRGLRDTIHVLLIGLRPGLESALGQLATQLDGPRFEWSQVERPELACARLAERSCDVVLLAVEDAGRGLDSLQEIVHRYPTLSVIAIPPAGLEDVGLAAIHAGAQDYLLEGGTDAEILRRVVRSSVERNRLWTALRETALVDELTGLYNRRGFLALARHQLRLAQRAKMDASLLFIDVDDMKYINDTFGHRHGDLALIETADFLRSGFRDSDLFGRIGGDEFVVLALESADTPISVLVARLREQVELSNAGERPFDLSFSVGEARFTSDDPCSVQLLLARADATMYEQKRRKRRVDPLPANAERRVRLA